MNNLLMTLTLLLAGSLALADSHGEHDMTHGMEHDHAEMQHDMAHDHDHADHAGHGDMAMQQPDGDEAMFMPDADIDYERINAFFTGLTDEQVAMVSVNGLVCDFCARGIEKAFNKSEGVKKIDVNLQHGQVLIAYDSGHSIDTADIEAKITANGQSPTDIRILELGSGL